MDRCEYSKYSYKHSYAHSHSLCESFWGGKDSFKLMAHNNLMRYQKRKLPTHNGTLWVELGRAAQGIFLLFFSIKQIAEFDIFLALEASSKENHKQRRKKKKKKRK